MGQAGLSSRRCPQLPFHTHAPTTCPSLRRCMLCLSAELRQHLVLYRAHGAGRVAGGLDRCAAGMSGHWQDKDQLWCKRQRVTKAWLDTRRDFVWITREVRDFAEFRGCGRLRALRQQECRLERWQSGPLQELIKKA